MLRAKSIDQAIETLQSLYLIEKEVSSAENLIISTLDSGKKILICGNGGSAAEAQHFSTELVGRYALKRRSLPAIALSADGSLLTCIGNDFGFESIFSRQIEGLAEPGDLIITLSSSGNSINILKALETAKNMSLNSISFLGCNGGLAKGLATVDLIVPGDSGRAAQEAHLFLIHHFCDCVDEYIKGTQRNESTNQNV